MVEYLPHMSEALGSMSSTTKKERGSQEVTGQRQSWDPCMGLRTKRATCQSQTREWTSAPDSRENIKLPEEDSPSVLLGVMLRAERRSLLGP